MADVFMSHFDTFDYQYRSLKWTLMWLKWTGGSCDHGAHSAFHPRRVGYPSETGVSQTIAHDPDCNDSDDPMIMTHVWIMFNKTFKKNYLHDLFFGETSGNFEPCDFVSSRSLTFIASQMPGCSQGVGQLTGDSRHRIKSWDVHPKNFNMNE